MHTIFRRQGFLGSIGSSLLLFLVSSITGVSFSASAFAQLKYNPDDEAVRVVAERGINFLRKGKLNGKTQVLAAVALIEYTKRYDERVPAEDPLVVKALKHCEAAMVEEERSNGPRPYKTQSEIYEMSLALILFAEVDDERYAPEINKIIGYLVERQNRSGSFGYRSQVGIGDTSQAQYAGLAFWVAKSHGFDVPVANAKGLLEWLCRTNDGSWTYHYKDGKIFGGDKNPRQSLHCAGLGTVYLLADFLQLNERKGGGQKATGGLDLPPSVSIYVKPKENGVEKKEGPLTNFDRALLGRCSSRGNLWLRTNWKVKVTTWNYYYLYALERYAYFREQAEGEVGGIPDWYDQVVEFLMAEQQDNGSWPKDKGSTQINTAFAIMFLVRASEVLVLDTVAGDLAGGNRFAVDEQLSFNKDGSVTGGTVVQGVEDVLAVMKSGVGDDDLDFMLQSLRPAVTQMSQNTGKTANEQLSFLRGLISNENPRMRLVAVRLLAGQQTIENAPAMIFALGDEDRSIRRAAHDGLRLISRKVDTIELPDNPTPAAYAALKQEWTDWYLSVNPGGKLLE